MKRIGVILALALGLTAQGAMAKTLNVVSSFSVLGDMVKQVGGEHVHVDTVRTATRTPSSRRRRIARCSVKRMWWWLTGWGWRAGWTASLRPQVLKVS